MRFQAMAMGDTLVPHVAFDVQQYFCSENEFISSNIHSDLIQQNLSDLRTRPEKGQTYGIVPPDPYSWPTGTSSII